MTTITCIHISHERTSGTSHLKQGAIEDFPVANIQGDKGDFGFAFMRSPGKNGARIIAAFAIRDAVRVVFDKNPGADTSLTIKVDRRES